MEETIDPPKETVRSSSGRAERASLSDLLFPALYRRKALALLLLNPGKRLHARQIARVTGSLPGAMAKELAMLHKAGLLYRYTVGNQAQFMANELHPVFPELSALLRKTVGLADVLIEALKPLSGQIRVAFVFGSVARSAERAESDVDVLVIGSASFADVTEAIFPAQETLQRDVNVKVYAEGEWAERVAVGSAFVKELQTQPKIFLIGAQDELDALGQPGQDPQT